MAKISEFTTKNRFWDDLEHIPVGELLNIPIEISDVSYFENSKGPGVAIRFVKAGETEEFRTVTHSKAITDLLNNPDVYAALETGIVECKIVSVYSQTTKKTYYTLQ